jgi:hypothetical protein
MELENIMLSEESHAQNVNSHVFPSYMKAKPINTCTHKYIYDIFIYIYGEHGEGREHMTVLVGLSEGRRGK